eukprot:751149-Hanusia_phi.AAC.4
MREVRERGREGEEEREGGRSEKNGILGGGGRLETGFSEGVGYFQLPHYCSSEDRSGDEDTHWSSDPASPAADSPGPGRWGSAGPGRRVRTDYTAASTRSSEFNVTQ